VGGPLSEYSKCLADRLEVVSQNERLHRQLGNWKLSAVAVGLVLLYLCWARELFSFYWMLVPTLGYAALAVAHERILRALTRANNAATFYRKAIARIEDRWAGTGEPGERFRDAKHVYANDLDLFAHGGLFELLSTARLPMGQNRLAEWLQKPSSAITIRERQRLLAELRDKTELREDLAVIGEDLRVRLDPKSLNAWAEAGVAPPQHALRLMAIVGSVCMAAALVNLFLTLHYMPVLVLLVSGKIINTVTRRRIQTALAHYPANAEGMLLFAEILARLEAETFSSPGLQAFSAKLKEGDATASAAVRKLARLVAWIDGRGSQIAMILEWLALYSWQVWLAAEAWRNKHGKKLRAWVEITAEMEALLSLAGYSHEHPADPFPEILDVSQGQAIFDGEEIGHPLIPAERCVRNRVRLEGETRVLLISGSNMSGKSTLLRTVGINAVLAFAGAPVRANALRLTPVALGTRIRSGDSLQEGLSNFYAEILRIREVFELSSGEKPLLFLFDELLEGTNSSDRRIGAQGLIRALLDRDAIGMITTHDLALTEIASPHDARICNAHFRDFVENGQMRFDYKLHQGVATKSNALELMRLIGLKV
jgi:MutS domain V